MPTTLINTMYLVPSRAALCSLLLFGRRKQVENITIFGAGQLAFWLQQGRVGQTLPNWTPASSRT